MNTKTDQTDQTVVSANTDEANAMKGALVAALATILIAVAAIGALRADSLGLLGGLAIFATVFGVAVVAGLIIGKDD